MFCDSIHISTKTATYHIILHCMTQRTTLASSASTNPKTQSSRSDQSSNGGGGGGGAGRGSSKGGGKGSEGIVPKPPTPAVGAPVDADLQVNLNRPVCVFGAERETIGWDCSLGRRACRLYHHVFSCV